MRRRYCCKKRWANWSAETEKLASSSFPIMCIVMTDVSQDQFRKAYHDHIRNDVVPYVPPMGGKLLDVGGGIGGTAAHLKHIGVVEQAGTADLIDPSEALSELDFTYQGNLEDSEFIAQVGKEQGPFRIILALDILEHLVDPWAMVARLHKILEPDGLLIASIPNVRNYRATFPLIFANSWNYKDAGILDITHLRFFVRSTAISLTTSSGLKLENVIASASGGSKTSLFRNLTLGLFNSFTDRQYIVVARNTAGANKS